MNLVNTCFVFEVSNYSSVYYLLNNTNITYVTNGLVIRYRIQGKNRIFDKNVNKNFYGTRIEDLINNSDMYRNVIENENTTGFKIRIATSTDTLD